MGDWDGRGNDNASARDEGPSQCARQAAAAGLRTAMVRSTEVKIERHVSFLATLQADRGAEAQSGHNTKLVAEKCVAVVHGGRGCVLGCRWRVGWLVGCAALSVAWVAVCPPAGSATARDRSES